MSYKIELDRYYNNSLVNESIKLWFSSGVWCVILSASCKLFIKVVLKT